MTAAVAAPAPFAAVWFDCDSTLCAIEGVDELLRFAPPALRTEIATLTERAMNGDLPLADVYGARLAALQPRQEQLEAVGELYCQRLTAGARETVAALQWLGKQVGICSGGLLLPVWRVARELGIDREHVRAVAVTFAADGSYLGFEPGPLTQNGGKATVLAALPAASRPLAFVGDGVTDLETMGHVARFVGFGGVVARAVVRQRAEFFTAAPTLAAVLPFVTTAAEQERLRGDATFQRLLSAPPS